MLNESSPKLRLEIYSCETQGSENLVLTLCNDQEVVRRVTQLKTWLILSTVTGNNDIATLIVAYIRNLFDRGPSSVSFEPLVFDETIRKIADNANMKIRIRNIHYNADIIIRRLEQVKQFFVCNSLKNEILQKVEINIGDWYVPAILHPGRTWIEEIEHCRRKEAMGSMIAIMLCSLFLHVSSIGLTVHSHDSDSLFRKCQTIMEYAKDCFFTKTVLGRTFWLNTTDYRETQSVAEHASWMDSASSLKIVDCMYCVRHAMEKEQEKRNLLLTATTLEEQRSSWCISQ